MATLSTNPRAGWATQAYGATGQPADVVRRVVEFFQAHGVPAKMRVVPDGFTPEQADVLVGLGLQHVGFHTILWSSLPSTVESTAPADIREVSTPEEMVAYTAALWIQRPERPAID